MTALSASGSTWNTRPLMPALGIEIEGVDLASVDHAAVKEIDTLFGQHGALLFRDQKLEADALVRFSRYFGDLDEVIQLLSGAGWILEGADIEPLRR